MKYNTTCNHNIQEHNKLNTRKTLTTNQKENYYKEYYRKSVKMAAGQKHAQLSAKDSTIRFPFHEKISDAWSNGTARDGQTQS